jgi:hypothetical protein
MAKGERISIIVTDGAFGAAVGTYLTQAGLAAASFPTWQDWLATGDVSKLLILDAPTLNDDQFGILEKKAKTGLEIICLTANDDETIHVLQQYSYVNSTIGGLFDSQGKELICLVNRLLTRQDDDLDVYLLKHSSRNEETLKSYADKNGCLDRLHAFLAKLSSFPDFPEVVVSVVWEMLMNAFIDAPKLYKKSSNNVSIPRPSVRVRYGANTDLFAISVEDNYGTLTRRKVVDTLERCHKQGPDQIKSGPEGAGIGLYLMFIHASQLHFNVHPGKMTQVILVTRVSKRYREFSRGGKSFNFIVEE